MESLTSHFLHSNLGPDFLPRNSKYISTVNSILCLCIPLYLTNSKLSGVLGTSGWVVWIHEKLQVDQLSLRRVRVRPINLVHFLHLGNKKNVGGVRAQKETKQWRIWKTYSWPLFGLKFFNRSVITVPCVERTIAIYDFHLS
jgi:hypothetical protein